MLLSREPRLARLGVNRNRGGPGGVLGLIGIATAWLFVGFFLLLGVWLWAIIDTAVKPTTYYQRFPRG
jgi:hypothetical protein